MEFPFRYERRRAVRQRVHYRMDVVDEQGELFGCLIDLSTSGMRIQTSEEHDILHVERLRIELPRWLELGPSVRVEGRFVWCKARVQGRVEAGFAFTALAERDRVILEQLLERLTLAAEEDGIGAAGST